MTVHFVLFLVSVKFRGLPRVTTARCVFSHVTGTSHQLHVSTVATFFFSLYFWLPHLASYSTLKLHPSLSLVQTCKVLFMDECHLFQEVLLLLQVLSVRYKAHSFHTPVANGDCEQSVSHRNPCGKLFTQRMNFEDLASYSAFLLYVFCVGK